MSQIEIVVDVPQSILDNTLALDDMLQELGATAKRQTMERFSGWSPVPIRGSHDGECVRAS